MVEAHSKFDFMHCKLKLSIATLLDFLEIASNVHAIRTMLQGICFKVATIFPRGVAILMKWIKSCHL